MNYKVNIGILVFFILEMLIKIVGLGFKRYFIDHYNKFDFLIIWLTILDLIFEKTSVSIKSGRFMSALRSLRLLRVFKVTKVWKSF